MRKPIFLWLLLLASCAPSTSYIAPPGRTLEKDIYECELEAMAVTPNHWTQAQRNHLTDACMKARGYRPR